MSRLKSRVLLVSSALGLVAVTGCSSDQNTLPVYTPPVTGATTAAAPTTAPSSATEAVEPSITPLPQDCVPTLMTTKTPRTLTIATTEQMDAPWFIGNDPSNQEGLESALAYAVASRLGFEADRIAWTQVMAEDVRSGAELGYDFALGQFPVDTLDPDLVDVTPGYFDLRPTVVTTTGSSIAGVATAAELSGSALGVVGDESLDAVGSTVSPGTAPVVYPDRGVAAEALIGGQIDALVVDLPTALQMTSGQLDGTVVVGQLPVAEPAASLGLVLGNDSTMTACATAAVESLRSDGVLTNLAAHWITEGAPARILG